MNRDLDYVLNYMVKYTKDRFMQDSEPMLNHKDIELVLKHIYKLEQENKQLNRKIDTLAFWINETINTIEEQPTGNDEYILTRLYSFMSILGDKE